MFYYKDLDPPYACRNGPIPDLNELLFVKGITPELFYGDDETPGMLQFMTIHGVAESGPAFHYPGRININTADFPVLMALMPLEDEDLVRAMLEYRQEAKENQESSDFSNPRWYNDIPGLGDINLNPKLITTSSDIFRIEATAKLHDTQLKTVTVVQRIQRPKTGKWSCKVLSWKTE